MAIRRATRNRNSKLHGASGNRQDIGPGVDRGERMLDFRVAPLAGHKGDNSALSQNGAWQMAAADQEFLLYPLDTGDDPICPACGTTMVLASHESREVEPNFLSFRCVRCGRSERFICEK
jgi:ribosomal protein S27AE